MELKGLGVTPQKEKQFAKKGIFTAEDLTRFLPRRYLDLTRETGILPEDEVSCVRVRVERLQTAYGRIQTLKARCVLLSTGQPLTVTWFNQNYLKERLQALTGREVWAAGKVRGFSRSGGFELPSPELFEPDAAKALGIRPVYPKIPGMSGEYLAEKLALALDRGRCRRRPCRRRLWRN